MKKLISISVLILVTLLTAPLATAAADLEVNTPAISSLKGSMQARHGQLAAHYASGAVGLTKDGLIAMRDANAVPLAQRQSVNSLIAAENNDRNTLYKEIASANGHPEWQDEVRSTFAQRWCKSPGRLVVSGWRWLGEK